MQIDKTFEMLIEKLEGWFDGLVLMLPNLLVAFLLLAAFVLLTKVLRRVLGRVLGRVSQRTPLNRLVVNLLSFGVMCVGLLTSLSVLHLDKAVMSLLAGVGVVGLALGFAFQDIAANFMAGVLILMRRPLRVGDIVESNGFFGRVATLDLRNTVIRTWAGQDVLVPNKQVFQNPLVNYSRTSDRRVDLAVGVSYGDDLERAEQIATEAVKRLPHRDETREPELYYTGFGNSSIDFQLRIWIDTAEERAFFAARSAAVKQLKAAFDRHGITIPFPIRTLDFGIKGGRDLSQVLDQAGNGRRARAPGLLARTTEHDSLP